MPKEPASNSLRQQAAAGGRWTAVSAIASLAIQLIQLAVLGRLLEPSDFGLMATMMIVIGLATSISDFGVGNYIVQVSIFSRQLFRRLFALGIALSIILSVIIFFTTPWITSFYDSPLLKDLLPWFGVVVITSTSSQIYFSVLQRALKFQTIAVVDIISSIGGLSVSVGLAWFGYGVWSLVAAQLSLSLIKTIFYFESTKRVLKNLPETCQGRVTDALRFGYFQIGERLLNFVGWNLDKVIIGKLLGDHNLGIYSIAFQLMMRPFTVLNPIFTRVSLPIFSKIIHDNKRLCRGYLDVVRTITLISFPIYIGLAIASPAIIEILMGAKWAEAAPIVSILCGLGFLFSLGNPIGTLILAKGRPDWAFYINLLALIVYAVAYYIGSFFGISGVALAFLIAAGAILYPLEFFLRWKLVGMTISEYFSALIHQLLGAALPMVILVYCTINNYMPQSVIYQLLVGASGASFFIVYLWFTEPTLIKSTYALVFSRK
jgi:O-antigen/teichoic acid export membrane protein